MTEKRFYTIHKGVYDELKRKELHHGEITSMLNALHEENEQLKKILGFLKNDNANDIVEVLNLQQTRIWELNRENGQLKSNLKYWQTLAQSLAKGNNIGRFEMMDKEVTIDLNELDINIQKEIIFKSDLNKWIEKKMGFYEELMNISDGYNYVNAKGHLDMLIKLKEWIKQRYDLND